MSLTKACLREPSPKSSPHPGPPMKSQSATASNRECQCNKPPSLLTWRIKFQASLDLTVAESSSNNKSSNHHGLPMSKVTLLSVADKKDSFSSNKHLGLLMALKKKASSPKWPMGKHIRLQAEAVFSNCQMGQPSQILIGSRRQTWKPISKSRTRSWLPWLENSPKLLASESL